MGKSTLFNRLIKQRKAIVDNIPGVTRDRNYEICTWKDQGFIIIDTGGLDIRPEISIDAKVQEQVHSAIKEADVIVFLMDGKEGLLPIDKEIYLEIKKSNKPILCVANKIDNERTALNLSDFYSLGQDNIFPVSAIHNIGIDNLMEQIIKILPGKKIKDEDSERIRLAIIGRPNVGKSSLLNKILRKERSLVTEIPGTTRDCIDTPFNYNRRSYLIIDTAGIRRRTKTKTLLEKVSMIKTIKNIENCQVALFIIDAVEGITEQDVRIAGIAHEAGKGIVIVVNKWDAIQKDDKTIKRFEEALRLRLKYLSYAPMVFISALTGQRVYKIFPLVEKVLNQYNTRISTRKINTAIRESTTQLSPPLHKGRKVKFYYQTQVSTQPPTFVFFVNYPEGIKFSYKRYLKNQIREKLGLDSTPLHLIFRSKIKEFD